MKGRSLTFCSFSWRGCKLLDLLLVSSTSLAPPEWRYEHQTTLPRPAIIKHRFYCTRHALLRSRIFSASARHRPSQQRNEGIAPHTPSYTDPHAVISLHIHTINSNTKTEGKQYFRTHFFLYYWGKCCCLTSRTPISPIYGTSPRLRGTARCLTYILQLLQVLSPWTRFTSPRLLPAARTAPAQQRCWWHGQTPSWLRGAQRPYKDQGGRGQEEHALLMQ